MWVRVRDATHWEGERPMCHSSGSVLRCAVLLLSKRGDIPRQLRLAPTSTACLPLALFAHARLCCREEPSHPSHLQTFSFSPEPTALCVGDDGHPDEKAEPSSSHVNGTGVYGQALRETHNVC